MQYPQSDEGVANVACSGITVSSLTAIKCFTPRDLNNLLASYKAWVNKNGTHETRAQGFRRWNDELLREMNQNTEHRWIALLLSLDEQSDAIQDAVKDELDNLNGRMRGILPVIASANRERE